MTRKMKNQINEFKYFIKYYGEVLPIPLDKNTPEFFIVKQLYVDYDKRPSLISRRIINDILDGNWNTYYELLPDVDWNDYSIDELEGSVRLHNQLYFQGIKTIADARSLTYEETIPMKQFGKKTWEELQYSLQSITINN